MLTDEPIREQALRILKEEFTIARENVFRNYIRNFINGHYLLSHLLDNREQKN